MNTLFTIIVIVTAKYLNCHQIDVKNAFRESRLDKHIYFSLPDGVNKKQSRIPQILQKLYILKQVGRNWNQQWKKELLGKRFTKSLAI